MLGDGRSGEVAPPPHALLICVIVSITYREELLSLPWLPCQQESLLCRQVTLNGWKGGVRAELQLEIRLVWEVKRWERAPPVIETHTHTHTA